MALGLVYENNCKESVKVSTLREFSQTSMVVFYLLDAQFLVGVFEENLDSYSG